MKAFYFCLILLIFTLSISLVNAIGYFGTTDLSGINESDSSSNENYYDIEGGTGDLSITDIVIEQITGGGSLSATTLLTGGGAIVGALLGAWSGNFSLFGISIFTGLFWGSYYDAMSSLYPVVSKNITSGDVTTALFLLLVLPVVYIFIAGIAQMLTGGWKAYE